MQLNEGTTPFVALVNLLNSNLVKLVYGSGYRFSGIESTSPTNGKVLMLTGEGDEMLGAPECLCLPESVRNKLTVKCPMDTCFQEHMQQNSSTLSWRKFPVQPHPSRQDI
eukprot:4934970-Ditylum_brightwellii.AAC.1